MKQYELTIIGGGIVGVATALKLKQLRPAAKILLVEKETGLARHQTGHNSGVIHAGVYYQPGSLKADFCRRGLVETYAFCRDFGIPVEQCGKLLVATDELELERMDGLEDRCGRNGIKTIRLSGDELKKREPHIKGIGALFVEETGITDYGRVTRKMAACFRDIGGEIKLAADVRTIEETEEGVRVHISEEVLETNYLLACGGLMADRLAKMMDIPVDFRIIPFRGEYYRLPDRYHDYVKHLIYPIPDPDLPFLGVHLTRMIDGSVTVGPNAVLGLKREGYGMLNISLRDVIEIVGFAGFWRMFKGNFAAGIGEFRDSLYRPGYLKRVRKYCPEVELSELSRYPAGIRAQAVLGDGTLVHDFLFARTKRSLHVCNAPSPAATSALPIGEYLSREAIEAFDL
jgi:L-2-hydroxyglutarate oxidase